MSRGRAETREARSDLALNSRSLSVQEFSSINSASVSSSIFSLQRDVKGVSDAQARLVRVIEDVSQELHQRLSHHEQQLEQLYEKEQSLQETFQQVQKEEKAWRQSLDAEYLRLRTMDGNFQTQMNFLESKMGQLEKLQLGGGRSTWPVESGSSSRMQKQIEEFRGTLETLEARLSGALSQQLQSQLPGIVQQQLQNYVQPQLQQQLQTQLKEVQGLEVQRLCEEQVKQVEQRLFSSQETLRQEAVKREQHLAELQDAAQRLAQTAMQRAQASTNAHEQVFSASSSLSQRLQVVEKDLRSLQRHVLERHKRRVTRLEELAEKTDVTEGQPSAPGTPQSSKRENGTSEAGPSELLRIDELRLQLYSELSDFRSVQTQLSGRVARCEGDILDLKANHAVEEGRTSGRQGTQSFLERRLWSKQRSPATPEWPSPWQVASAPKDLGPTSTLPALPGPPSPAPAPPVTEACPSSRLLQGMPEGPQLTSWDGDKESPQRGRFGVLPPPKVTPAVEPATL